MGQKLKIKLRLYMHNHDDKYPSRQGFEPGTPWLQAQVDTKKNQYFYIGFLI